MKFSEFPQHHALVLIDPNREATSSSFWNELRSLSQAHRFFNQTVLDIDTARMIITWANTPYNDEKIALISFHSASLPAQNALLKIIEEPPQGVRFIFLTTSKSNLIGTVLSRMCEVSISENSTRQKDSDAELFLNTKHNSRMKLPAVVSLLTKTDEEGRKDRESVRKFILSILDVLSNKKIESRYSIETIRVASYASDSSASGKALLEYLALLLPVVK